MPLREWKCECCRKEFSGECPYQQHLQSDRHKKLSEFPRQANVAQAEMNCKFCRKSFSGAESYIAHVVSKDHLRIVGNAEKIKKASLLQSFREKNDLIKCPECGVPFTCWESADDHFRSDQHIKKVSDDNKAEVLSKIKPKPPSPKGNNSCQSRCNICDVLLCGEEAIKQHNEGKIHKKCMKKLTDGEQEVSINDAGKTDFKEECCICKVPLSGKEAIEKHYLGRKHLKLKADLDNTCSNSGTVDLPSQPNVIEAQNPINDEELARHIQKVNMEKQRKIYINDAEKADLREECCICKVPLFGKEAIEKHYIGKKHLKQKADLDNKFSNSEIVDLPSQPNIIVAQNPINDEELARQTENVNMEKQRKISINDAEKDLKEECCICKVPLLGKEAIEKHYIGKKHLKQKADLDNKFSNSGIVDLPSQPNIIVAQNPINDEELARQTEKVNMEKQRKISINDAEKDLKEECYICEVSLLGKEAIEMHYVEKNHLKQQAELDNKCSNSGIVDLPSQPNIMAQKPINEEEVAKQMQKVNTEKQRIPDNIELHSDNSINPISTQLPNPSLILKLESNNSLKSEKVKKNHSDKHLEEKDKMENKAINTENLRNSSIPTIEKSTNADNIAKKEKLISDNACLISNKEEPNKLCIETKSQYGNRFKANPQQCESKICESQTIISIGMCEAENSEQTREMQVIKDKLETSVLADLNTVTLSDRVSDPLLENATQSNNDVKINQLKNNVNTVYLRSKRQTNDEYPVRNKSLDTEKSCREKISGGTQKRDYQIELCGVKRSLNDNTIWQRGCLHCGILSFCDKSAYKRHIKSETHIIKIGKRL